MLITYRVGKEGKYKPRYSYFATRLEAHKNAEAKSRKHKARYIVGVCYGQGFYITDGIYYNGRKLLK